jgi:hypothetical protein
MKIDVLLDQIYQVLPAQTRQEICEKFEQEWGFPLPLGTLDSAMCHLRKNPGPYGWTMPHARRGRPIPGEEGRFFAVLVDKGGAYLTADNRSDQIRGLLSTAQQTITQMGNCASALEAAALHVRSQVAADMAKDLAADFRDLRRRAARTFRAIEQANGTNGA